MATRCGWPCLVITEDVSHLLQHILDDRGEKLWRLLVHDVADAFQNDESGACKTMTIVTVVKMVPVRNGVDDMSFMIYYEFRRDKPVVFIGILRNCVRRFTTEGFHKGHVSQR